jgi:hypothetical protein
MLTRREEEEEMMMMMMMCLVEGTYTLMWTSNDGGACHSHSH